MTEDGDRIVRALTNDGSFRVITACTTTTVRGVVAAQRVAGTTARHLADIVTGAVLVRETMAPNMRVQAIAKGEGGAGSLVADSHPEGNTRGLANEPEGGEFRLGEGALLQVLRTLPNGELHQGVVSASRDGGISGALMSYMQRSEQITTTISVSGLVAEGEVQVAGGYCVQVLPEIDQAMLATVIYRLERLDPIDTMLERTGADPDAVLSAIMGDIEHTKVEETRVRYHCPCSAVSVLGALASLGRPDIESLLSEDKPIEMSCDFCNSMYEVPHAQLRGLLNSS